MPPQFQNQAPFQHIRHQTPSASPPIQNGVPFHHPQRQRTPQPQVGSRPSSRNGMRRPPSLTSHHGLPQPSTNGYAYIPQPAIYNGPVMPAHPPAQHVPPQAPFQYPGPQPPHPPHQLQQVQQVYMDERRTSMPPAFPQQERPSSGAGSTPPQSQRQQIPPQPHHQQIPQPQQQIPQQIPHEPEPQQQPQPPQQQQQQPPPAQMLEPKRISIKSRSIFTPIDESRSILSQHWASSTSAAESSKSEATPPSRSQSIDTVTSRQNSAIQSPPQPQRSQTHDKTRNASMSSMDAFTPPSRTNSAQLGAKRPRLKVQIPDEPSDGGSATADSSPHDSTDATGTHPSRRAGTDGSHSSGVVLPPPSPSASALLSAGASGPPNPFARPPPPSQNHPTNTNNNIDTPVSALPSRFMNNDFLPSPSSFYPEWNFRGADSNTLPSPLNFATPIIGSGPSFLRDEGAPSGKRKTPEAEEGGDMKRMKHEN